MRYCGNIFSQIRISVEYLFTHNPKLTWIRFWNRALVYVSRIMKVSRCVSKPAFLYVEPSAVCTLACPFCPCGSGKRKLRNNFMELEKYKMVIDKTYPQVIAVGLFMFGEPLLNRQIVPMVEYSTSKGVLTSIHTNMSVMDAALAEGLVKAGLFNLVLSVDGCSQSAYEKYRVGGDINRVFKNIEILINARKRLKRNNPLITWQYLVNKHNEGELGMARETAKRLGVDFFAEHLLQIPPDREIIKTWAPGADGYSLYDRQTFKEKQRPPYCNALWETLRIDCQGDVYFCCFSADTPAHNYGNIFTGSLKDLWNTPAIVSARRAVGGEALGADKVLCFACRYLPANFAEFP